MMDQFNDTRLHKAVQERDFYKVQSLINFGANIEAEDEYKNTPLLCAVFYENLEIVELLINSGARINKRDKKGRGPLHTAARKNKKIEMTNLLLDKKVEIEEADEEGNTPLMLAVYYENFEIVELLINSGARINKRDKRGQGLLHKAAKTNKKIEITKLILDKGGDIEEAGEDGNTPLMLAVFYENLEIVKFLINKGAIINKRDKRGQGLLHKAAKTNKNIEITKLLLDKKVEIEEADEDGNTPLMLAVYYENLEIVKFLINKGAIINKRDKKGQGLWHKAAKTNKNIEITNLFYKKVEIEEADEDGNTPLMCAVYYENLEIVKFLIKKGANIKAKDKKGQGLLHIAARKNKKVEMTKLLLDKGGDIEEAREDGNTPLMLAVYYENLEIVTFLINKGAIINKRDKTGEGLLHKAAQTNKNIEITKLLLDKKVEIEEADEDGNTPLLEAVYFENLEIVKFLIKKEANIKAKDENGNGSLHTAAKENMETKVTEYLLDEGADIEAVNDFGDTPLMHAVYNTKLKLVEFLLEKKANIKAKNIEGKTSLHFAVENIVRESNSAIEPEALEIIEVLLKHKPEISAELINAADNKQVTPLGLAKENKKNEIIQLFSEYS